MDRIADSQERLSHPRLGIAFDRLLTTPPWLVPSGEDPDQEDFEGWRRWIASYVDRVEVRPGVRGLNRFDPARVTIAWKG